MENGAQTGTEPVAIAIRDRVAVVTVANPPVNALVQPVRAGIFQAIERAEADDDVGAVVIQAEGKTFPAGADVREFTGKAGEPTLRALCDRVEACTKPVIAAIHGTALGGGLELALACHYRISAPDARFGFPEVTLGLVPNAGGTQRMPRIAGPRAALDLLVTGKPIDAPRALALRLVDKVVNKGLAKAAFGTARNMATNRTPARPTRDETAGLQDASRYLELVEARRKVTERDRSQAMSRAIDLVEAALLVPFEAGLEMEHVAYQDLVNAPEARGLRHAFLAERRAGRFANLAGVTSHAISKVGVVGAGPLARDIAMAALSAGVQVTIALEDDSAISRARARIEASLARAVEAGRMTGATRDGQLGRLTVSDLYGALSDADVMIEALPEDPVRKGHVLKRLGEIALSRTVIASSTADCDIPTLSRASGRPESFAAMHFIAPADRNRLVEIAPGPGTDPAAIATLVRLARAMQKGPVATRAATGLVFNRMVTAYYSAAALLLEQGAMPGDVDGAMRGFGMPLGPFQAQDIAGLDAVWGLRAESCASDIPLVMLENAWYGQRTGQGFYRYADNERGGRAAPEVLSTIRALRDEKGIKARNFSPDQIRRRCLFAMANEGARLVQAQIVARPSDVDAALLMGLGFPRTKGGPMLQADLTGSLEIRKSLRQWRAEDEFWQPVALWDDLVKFGRHFDAMNVD